MRMLKAALAALLLCLGSAGAWAQGSLLQSGPPVNGHAPVYVGSGLQAILGDSGTAAGGVQGLGFSELLLQARGTGTAPFASQGHGPLGTNWCDYDGPTTTTPYHYLCFSANAQGGALITTGAGNGATAQPLIFNINGTNYDFPVALSGVVGPATSVVNDVACWNNTNGTLLKDCGVALGTVTSVGLTMPTGFTVTGSPITGAGTFAVSFSSESANLILASPNGAPGVPSFRALLGADFGTQSANTVLAGPSSGGAASPTYRTMVGADLPNPSSSTLGGIQSAAAVTHQWINSISTSGGPSLSQPSYADLSGSPTPTALAGAASGFVNKLRGTTLSQWYSGTSVTVGTSITWTSEGVACIETGATITASQLANPLTSPLSFWSLKLLGNTSNTDLKCRFVIESYDSAPLAGQTVTFQIPIQNKTGGSITPTIATKYPTAQDNWASSTADLAATNLQGCANNATCTLAYTFNVNAGANNGYEVVIDFGALANTAFVAVGGGFDLRVTAGVSLGLNASPPAPEVYAAERDAAWNQRFYETSYSNGVAPGTVTGAGASAILMAGATAGNAGNAVRFNTKKRGGAGTLSLTGYSPITGTSAKVADITAGADVTASIDLIGDGGFRWFGSGASAISLEMHWVADARIPGG